MQIAKDITDLIGKTPILALDRLYDGYNAKVYAKLELFNPMSIKDRPVLSMVKEAVKMGKINSTIEVVEASSGNTAIALAVLGVIMKFPVCIFISEEVTRERRQVLTSFGAKIVLTPAIEHTKGARNRAISYCRSKPNTTFFLNQHGNRHNSLAHHRTTGPEIWEQLDGNINAAVMALGTCGTFDGLSSYLKSRNETIEIIGVEPAGSPLYSGGNQGKHKIDGMGPGFVSDLYKKTKLKPDKILKITDKEAFEWTRRVAIKEGILVGLTSGALAWAAHQLASKVEYRGKTIVVIFCDTGERYMSVPNLFPIGDPSTI